MTVLIIGASGFIGSRCYEYFSQLYKTIGVDSRISDNSMILTDPNFSVTTKIIEQHKPHVIINCAGSSNIQKSFSDPISDYELNTALVKNILEILKDKSPETKFINLSSAAVYGNPEKLPVKETDPVNPLSPYGKHKLMSEDLMKDYAKAFGLRTLSVRIFSAYGIGLKKQFFYDFSRKLLNNPDSVILHGTGDESRDFIYINDIVEAFHCLFRNSEFTGEVINLANGNEAFIKVISQSYATIFGYKGKIVFNGEQLKGYPLNWKADITKIKLLGFEQKISLEKGMELYADWIKQNLKE